MENLIPDFDDIVFETPVTNQDELEKTEDIEDTPIAEDVIMEYGEDADPVAISVFEELKARNYIYTQENFDGKWESLDRYFETLPQAVLNSVVESYPEYSKDVLKFIATAGENLTEEELKNFFKTKFEEQQEISIETADEAREYLKQIYTEQGLKPKAIERMLDGLEDDDELEETAKEEYAKRKQTTSKTNKLIEDKQIENDNIKQERMNFISDVEKEISTLNWKAEKIKQVKSILNNQTFSNTLREITSNPKSLVQLADILSLYDSKNKQFNLDVIRKQGASNQNLTIKERLEKNAYSSGGTNTKHQHKNLTDGAKFTPIFD